MNNKRVAVDTAVVTTISAVSQVASFVLFAAVATLFGANWQTDAFFLALTIPALFIGPVVNAISSTLFPVMVECRIKRPEAFGGLIGSALVYVLVPSVAASAGIALAAPSVIRMTGRALSEESLRLVTQQILLLLPIVVIQTLIGVLSAAYNSVGLFWLPAAANLARPLMTIGLLLVLKPALGMSSLPLSFVCGAFLQLGIAAGFWKSLGATVTFGWRIDPAFRRSLRLSLPLIVGTVALQCNLMISRFLAAHLAAGSVTVLDYASRISNSLMDLLTGGAFLVSLADWAAVVARGDTPLLRARLRSTILVVLFAILPIVAVLFVLRNPVVEVLLERGRFPPALTATTAAVFGYFLVGIPLDVIGQAYVRLFLARQDTWVIGGLATLRLVTTTVFSLWVMRIMAVRGLALANLVGIVAVLIGLVTVANRRLGNTLLGIWVPLGRLGLTAAAAGLAAAAATAVMQEASAWVRLPVAATLGFSGYLLLAWVLRVEELAVVLDVIRGHRTRSPVS